MDSLRKLILAIFLAIVGLSAHAQFPVLNSYPTAKATVYLDFYGKYIHGTIWNLKGPIDAQSPDLSSSAIIEIFNRIADNFQLFNLNITTDSNVFNRAPLLQRMRIIFTPSGSWFGSEGGASAIGSFTWGDDTPAWVFCEGLGNNTKYIADAASHEIGHTLGLQHQSLYDAMGNKVAEYNGGKGSRETGWAPIMGVNYYKNHTGWLIGTSTVGSGIIQNDLDIIAGSPNNFGFRKNDFNNDDTTHTAITLTSNRQNELYILSWKTSSQESIDHFTIELTKDGIHFQTLALISASDHLFPIHASEADDLSYRIKAWTSLPGASSTSNTIFLKASATEKMVWILNNPIRDLLTVISKGNFNYQLYLSDGKLLSNGILHTGNNTLSTAFAPKGLLILHWNDHALQGSKILIKQ